MADVSQDQGGTPPRRPVLRPFSGGARGAGQGPLKPLGARRLAVSSFPTGPAAGSSAAEGHDDAAALPLGDAGSVAVAVESPPSVQGSPGAELETIDRPTAAASIELSDPAAMPLETAPDSALDVASLDTRVATSTAWDGEGIAFGSAAAEPVAARAEPDATPHVIAAFEPTTVESEPGELSLEPSNVAMSADGAGAFAVMMPEFDASVETVEPVAASHANEAATEVETIGRAPDLDALAAAEVILDEPSSTERASDAGNESVSGFCDAESVSVSTPVEAVAIGAAPSVEAEFDEERVEDRLEGVAGIVASIAVSDEATTSPVGEAPSAVPEWSGELESVRLEAHASEGDVVVADAVELIHTPNADAEADLAGEEAPEAIVVESAAPLLDVELEGFHLKPEEVLEVPAPIPGFERMTAALPIDNVEGAPTAVAAAADESVGVRATIEGDASGDGEGASTEEGDPWRVASAPPETLAQGDADLQAFVSRSRSQAHVLETLEAVARRVRGGEIVPTTDAGASPEAVLASVLASLLSARP